jgi:hypothetical protein
LQEKRVSLEQLRDLSLVIIGIETFLLCLVLAVALVFAIRGTSQAILKVRMYGPVARGYFRKMAEGAERSSQQLTAPMVSLSTARARVGRTLSATFAVFSTRKEV